MSPPVDGKRLFKDVNMHDVMCGRGGLSNKHNVHFRIIVDTNKAEYLQARKSEKRAIAQRIVDTIHQRGGRFIKKVDENASDSPWFEVDEKRALEKTSQALREGLNVREDAPAISGSYGRLPSVAVVPTAMEGSGVAAAYAHPNSDDKSEGANKKAKKDHKDAAQAAAPVPAYGHVVHPSAIPHAYAAYPPPPGYGYPPYGYTAYPPPAQQPTAQGHYYSPYPPPPPYPTPYAHAAPPAYPYAPPPPGYYAAPYGASSYAYYIPSATAYPPGTQPYAAAASQAPASSRGEEPKKKDAEKKKSSSKSQEGVSSEGKAAPAPNSTKAADAGPDHSAGAVQEASPSSDKNKIQESTESDEKATEAATVEEPSPSRTAANGTVSKEDMPTASI